MAPFTGQPTHAQQIAIAMTPKITGFLSLLGSGYIVVDCLRQLKSGERGRGGTVSTSSSAHTYQRLMIGMSISDMIMSFGFVLSTLPAPRGTPYVWGAVGNTTSCTVTGIATMTGVVPVMYNASLSIYYLLRIRNGWTQTQLRSVELWLHGIPWIWGIAVVIVSLWLKLFNSGNFECWLAPFPQDCVASYKRTAATTAPVCTRGDNIELYQWGFDLIPKLSSICIVTMNMYLTWRSLHVQEQQTKKYSMGHLPQTTTGTNDNAEDAATIESKKATRPKARWSSPLMRRPSQIVAVKLSVAQRLARQSYFYVGALYITYLPVIVARIYEGATGYVHWEMLYIISFMIPIQGFWNALVYLRPRYLQYRKDEKKRQKRAELGTLTCALEGYAGPAAETAPQPVTHKTILQTIGDTFRDGAIDDENELMYDDALERVAESSAAAASTNDLGGRTDSKVSPWHPEETKQSGSWQSLSSVTEAKEQAPAKQSRDLSSLVDLSMRHSISRMLSEEEDLEQQEVFHVDSISLPSTLAPDGSAGSLAVGVQFL